MKKSVFLISLISGTVLIFPKYTIASNIFDHTLTYTHTHKLELPLKFSDKNAAYKTAAVCFLGGGDCNTSASFGKGEDFSRPGSEICIENGYSITSCEVPFYPYNPCPEDSSYYKECKEDKARACREAGYVTDCADGYILDDTQICPYDSSYKKCKCNPCEGYDYTAEEASAEGFEPADTCNSCGTIKYKRQNASCSGYFLCDCGGEIGSTTCKSGSNVLFSACKSCEPPCDENCPSGYYEGISCAFGSKSIQNECKTKTCYQCSQPNPSSTKGCWEDCPEGYTYDVEKHDYVCNKLTCEDLIRAKYPNYVSGDATKNYYVPNVTNLDNACFCYNTENGLSLINSDILSPIDFADEFPSCGQYCRPSFILENTTFQGDVELTYTSPNTYYGRGVSSNIIVNGNLTSRFSHITDLTLNANSTVTYVAANGVCPLYKNVFMYPDSVLSISQYCGTIENLTMYSGATINGDSEIKGTISIIGTSEDKPVKISTPEINGTINSSHYVEGTDGGLYLYFTGDNINLDGVKINRNPIGKITLTSSSSGTGSSEYYCSSLFMNPGPDTYVEIKNPKANSGQLGSCIYFNGRILATEGKNSAVITFSEGASSYTLPRCCSEDYGCPESVWNGSVKCIGKAKCYLSDSYDLPRNTSNRKECTS